MPELHQATPLKLVEALDNRISFLYLLQGGEWDSQVVLVSSVTTPNYEETAIFPCADWDGENADWENVIVKIYHVDVEDALNQIGYTTLAVA